MEVAKPLPRHTAGYYQLVVELGSYGLMVLLERSASGLPPCCSSISLFLGKVKLNWRRNMDKNRRNFLKGAAVVVAQPPLPQAIRDRYRKLVGRRSQACAGTKSQRPHSR